jgi:hypothetical protein
MTTTTMMMTSKHGAGCPCVHCYGEVKYDIRSTCMTCEQKIPHGNVQRTAIGVMHRECAYLLGWTTER